MLKHLVDGVIKVDFIVGDEDLTDSLGLILVHSEVVSYVDDLAEHLELHLGQHLPVPGTSHGTLDRLEEARLDPLKALGLEVAGVLFPDPCPDTVDSLQHHTRDLELPRLLEEQ